jgi:hypothetical protein
MRLIATTVLALSALALSVFLTPVHAMDESPIPKEWLQKQITIAEAETAYPGITDDRVKNFPDAAKPFGFRHAEWEAFKTHMQPGDQLWTFMSPPKSWEDLAGRSGIALVRNGAPIETIIGAMN